MIDRIFGDGYYELSTFVFAVITLYFVIEIYRRLTKITKSLDKIRKKASQ